MRAVFLLAACGGLIAGSCLSWREHEASPQTVERSFAEHRDRSIGGEPVLDFLARRTAVLIAGSAEPSLDLLERGRGPDDPPASFAAATAIAPDGYFLTACHAASLGALVLFCPSHGEEPHAARVLWSNANSDVTLLHADVELDAWFELQEDRPLAAGEMILAYGVPAQAAAGGLEVAVDLTAHVPYEVLQLPHGAPLRGGFSGGPAVLSDGSLLGVLTSTGMDTIFHRRSWLARPSPELLRRLIDADRRSP